MQTVVSCYCLKIVSQVLKARQTFCENHLQRPVASDLTAVRTSVQKWFSVRSHCTFLFCLLQTVRATEKTKWPAGYILLVGTEGDCRVLYLGNPAPKLLLVVDYRTINSPMLTVLGATAYSEPLSIGSAPTIAPTAWLTDDHNGDSFLHAECANGQWTLHCGPLTSASYSKFKLVNPIH